MSKVTKSDKKLHLSEKQEIAIREILMGKSDGDVATVVGVSRKTVQKWKNTNPFFQAELNLKREEAWKDFLAQYQHMIESAMKAIKEAISNGDVKSARWLIERSGFDQYLKEKIEISPPKGSVDPYLIISYAAEAEARRTVGIERPTEPDGFTDFFKYPSPYTNDDEIDSEAERIYAVMVKAALKEQAKELDKGKLKQTSNEGK